MGDCAYVLGGANGTPQASIELICAPLGSKRKILQWKNQNVFLDNFENSDVSIKLLCFWRTKLWYQLLVGETTSGGFETFKGDKTIYLFHIQPLLEIQRIQMELPTKCFCRYFTMLFTDWIFSLAKIIGIHWQNHSVGIYRGNDRQNINNFKKQSSAMTWKFLWMILPMKLQWDSNQDVCTVMCLLHW